MSFNLEVGPDTVNPVLQLTAYDVKNLAQIMVALDELVQHGASLSAITNGTDIYYCTDAGEEVSLNISFDDENAVHLLTVVSTGELHG